MAVILVTGASGFVGRHLLERLDREHEVVGWSRSAPPALPFAHGRWMRVDIRSRPNVHAALRELQPVQVYHLAGASHLGRSWGSPIEPLRANVMATHHLLDGLRRAGTRSRVLVTGSAAVYAPSADPLDERSRLAPESPYGFSKLGQEMLALRAVQEDGLDVIVTRSFNHTGPGQTAAYVAPSIARQVARIERGEQEAVIRVGNREPRRDITDVRDVVDAYVALMRQGTAGEVYNVASGVAWSVGDILDALIGASRVAVRIETDPALIRPTDNPVLIGDASKLRAQTGWAPQRVFTQVMRDLLEWWRHGAV